ncbi:unnamed protein product [Schistosoma bovis]|nr:unnamed protein product [Schistosoma bovis]
MALRVGARYFGLLTKPREKPAFVNEIQKKMDSMDLEGKPVTKRQQSRIGNYVFCANSSNNSPQSPRNAETDF